MDKYQKFAADFFFGHYPPDATFEYLLNWLDLRRMISPTIVASSKPTSTIHRKVSHVKWKHCTATR